MVNDAILSGQYELYRWLQINEKMKECGQWDGATRLGG